MAKICLSCSQCGGSIVLDNSHEIGTCESCFAQFVVKQDQIVQYVTQNITKHVYGYEGKDIEELLNDAGGLLDLGNERLANQKYMQAMEIDSNCWNAWIGYARTLPSTYEQLLNKVHAYRSAYALARNEQEESVTYRDMVRYLPDRELRSAFVRCFNVASRKERSKIFDLVSGVIGCEHSEIASLAMDLCPDDWRAHFAMGKFRQIRARWAELQGGIFRAKQLPDVAQEVLMIFVRAYELAKRDPDSNAAQTVRSYVQGLSSDNSYKVFANEVLKRMA